MIPPRLRSSVFLLVFFFASPAQADDLFDQMKAFLSSCFPDQTYLPIPAAGDKRYRPKARWAFVNDIQKKVPGASTEKGWLFLTDGTDIASDVSVPLYESPARLSALNKNKLWNLALAAALQGTVQATPWKADLKASVDKDLTIDISVGDALVQTLPLFQAGLVHRLDPTPLNSFNGFLAEFFPGAKVRTIVSAVMAKNVKVALTVKNEASADLKAALADIFSIDFSGGKKDNITQEIRFDDWRYIGYEARIEKGKVLVTGGGLKDEDPEAKAAAVDVRTGNLYARQIGEVKAPAPTPAPK